MSPRITKRVPLFIVFTCVTGFSALAQKTPKADTTKLKKVDSVASLVKSLPKPDALKPYKDVVTADAKTATGFFKVHKIDDRLLFELPDSILGRDLLTVNRISKSSSEYRNPLNRLMSYSGDWIGESVIRFEKGGVNKIMLSVISYKERSTDSSANGLSKTLETNNIQPIYAAFPVKAINKDKHATVIDVTDFLLSDNPVFGYLNELKAYTMLGPVSPDRSYIDSIRAFPMNIEIQAVKTYSMPKPGSTALLPLTFEFNNSIVLLPK